MRILSGLCTVMIALSLAVAPAAARQSEPGVTTSRAGLGDSKARPVGRAPLPPGIEIAGPILGHSEYYDGDCTDVQDQPEGVGHMVQLCLALRHTGAANGLPIGTPIRVVIPAGTIFISEDDETQNGVLIRNVEIIVRPGQTRFIWLHLMCLNANRDSSAPGDVFVLGPVLRDPAFDALFKRLEGRRIPVEAIGEVQAAVWNVAEGRPITPGVSAALDQLPME